jgi:small-conductance mechanosensitive channel
VSGKNYRNMHANNARGDFAVAGTLNSLKRFAGFLILIVILAAATIGFFEFLVGSTNPPPFLHSLAIISIVFFFTAITLFFLRRIKVLLTPYIGLQAATILQFLSLGLTILVVMFLVLGIYSVSPSTLLTSAGIITITVGLVISTFVGGILSGVLVFTTYQFKIGEDVMVNNVPGKIIDMTVLVMRIRTDVGQITIPNSAIASGGVIITAVRKPEDALESRLHYMVGDRVITSFRNEEGTVTEITAFNTTIFLDSGKEITYLNNSILMGAVVIARVMPPRRSQEPLSPP